MTVSALAMIYNALDSIKSGRNVLVIAEPRSRAFAIARILVAVAKRRQIVCANHRGADAAAPWVYARGAGEKAELIAAHADIFRDVSAAFERQNVVPPKVREVTA